MGKAGKSFSHDKKSFFSPYTFFLIRKHPRVGIFFETEKNPSAVNHLKTLKNSKGISSWWKNVNGRTGQQSEYLRENYELDSDRSAEVLRKTRTI